MSRLADEALQVGIFARLSAAPLSVPVLDTVPEGTPYPYVVIGDATAADWNDKDTVGQRHTVTIHSWVRGGSRLACKAVQGEIFDLLDRQEAQITVVGHQVVLCQQRFSEVMQDPGSAGAHNGPLWHGVQRFEIFTLAN